MGGAAPIRHALSRMVATVTATGLLILFAAFWVSADAQARVTALLPTPSPTAAASPSRPASTAPGLHLSLSSGVLRIEVDVPVATGQAASVPQSSAHQKPMTPSTPGISLVSHSTSVTSATGTSTPPYPPTPPDSSKSSASAPPGSQPAPTSAPPYPPTAPEPSSGPGHPTQSKGTLVFVKGFLPRNAPAILMLLCVVCAVAVAVVVTLSGRRRRL